MFRQRVKMCMLCGRSMKVEKQYCSCKNYWVSLDKLFCCKTGLRCHCSWCKRPVLEGADLFCNCWLQKYNENSYICIYCHSGSQQ